MRVVIVEDDPRMQQEIARIVSALPGGKTVFTSDSARSTVDWLSDNPAGWDLAIVDLFLKQGHGFDVLRQCQKHKLPTQRVTMLSNYNREPVGSYADAAGADRFFDKSFDLDKLVDYCRDLNQEVATRETNEALRQGE